MTYLPESVFDLKSYYNRRDEDTTKIFDLTERLLELHDTFNDFFANGICKVLSQSNIRHYQYNDDKWQLDNVIKIHKQLFEHKKNYEHAMVKFLEGLCSCLDMYLKNLEKELNEFSKTGKLRHQCLRVYLNKARKDTCWQSIQEKAKEFKSKGQKELLQIEMLEN